MEEVLKKFGRYLLLDKIAQGGMAEIYRACPASMDGAGRLIVIKRIQQSFGSNAEFLQMFKSEIKVTMGFNHPNIVQVYDFGEEQSQPYIAMELVDGKTLRQFISRTNELKQPFPIELAAHIIAQAGAGLHYAHSYKDKITGEHLSIIHRDISPQNILLSYDGNVKVIDFGIAKATVNSESTRAGVIKGKPSYLSPEQIHGDQLDARCDIFALGAVLWEMLVGRKLFAGENDLAILKMIESSQTHIKPPSAHRPEVNRELDLICLRALSKQPDKRYQTAEEFQRALEKFLRGYAPEFNPSDLSYFAKDLFKDQIIEDRKHIQKLNEKAAQLLMEPVLDSVAVESGAQAGGDDETTRLSTRGVASSGARELAVTERGPVAVEHGSAQGRKPNAPYAGAQAQPMKRPVIHAPAQAAQAPRQRTMAIDTNEGKKKNSSLIWAAAALLGLVFLGPQLGVRIPVVSDWVDQKTGNSVGTLVLEGEYREATVTVNGKTLAKSVPVTLPSLPANTPLKVSVKNAAGESFEQVVNLKTGDKKYLPVVLMAGGDVPVLDSGREPASKMVSLKLNLIPSGPGATVLLNGKPINSNRPIIQVPMDSPLELNIERQGYKPFRREFVIESARALDQKEWPMDVPLDPLHFGFLTIKTAPSAEAIISMGGQIWTRKTPLENEKFPIGDYNIRLVNDLLGMEKTVTISIPENKVVMVEERLQLR